MTNDAAGDAASATAADALVQERDASLAVSDETVPQSATRLRIATYNIHKGVSAMSRKNRIHDLRLGLHALEADLVFLQEVQGRNDQHAERFDNWPEVAQHTFLAGDRWAQTAYGRNSVRTDGDHGNALLSRFPLIAHENIDISDHRFESRGLLHGEFEVDGVRVHCICAHLGLFEESRVRQADAMIARIRSHVPNDAPLVIAGDFNDWRHRLGRRLVESLGVREVFSSMETSTERRSAALARRATGYVQMQGARIGDTIAAPFTAKSAAKSAAKSVAASTSAKVAAESAATSARIAAPARTYPAGFPLLRLDRVYVRGFKIASAQVLTGPAWRKLSDHAPILAELVFDPQ
ncbi:MAG: endonuclease/exonuclease/phosphatase family protein [Burkholderiaceae bacterium]